MSNIHYSFFIIIFLLISCQAQQEDYKIPSSKMVEVLADVHLSEVALQSVSVSLKDSMAAIYYQQIFEIHDVTQEDFDHDIDIIRSQPKTLKLYYTKVLEKLAEGEKNFLSSKKQGKPSVNESKGAGNK